MKTTVKDLKRGVIYYKNNQVIYFAAGSFCYSSFEYQNKFKSLSELKRTIKNELNINL
jgi:hypothetical protein